MSAPLTGGSDIPLENQIDAVTGKLVQLLDEQRKKERTSNQSFWPNCEAAGEGYVGCNPLKHGQCPDEAEFATTFADKPFANTWSKDAVSGDMIRCIPAWMKGKTTEAKGVEKDLTRRVLGALIEIEESYPKAAKDAEFQWNTPCSDAGNLNQCEIMRNPPSYNAEGQLEYAKHGSRCLWRPLEETEAWVKGGGAGPKCITRFDHPYDTKPMTKADLKEIKTALALAEASDSATGEKFQDAHIAALDTVTTPYGEQRVKSTADLRDLQDAIVTLPLLPTASSVEKFLTWATKDSPGGFNANDSLDEVMREWGGGDFDRKVSEMFYSADGESGDLNYSNIKAAIKTLEEECEGGLNADGKVWHADNFAKGMGQWLVPEQVATPRGTEDEEYNTKLREKIATSAKHSWWQFAVRNLKSQTTWVQNMQVLTSRLAGELADDASRKKLELGLAPVVKAAGVGTVMVDMSLYSGSGAQRRPGSGAQRLGIELNQKLVTDQGRFEQHLNDNEDLIHQIKLTQHQNGVSKGVSKGQLYQTLKTEPLLRFTPASVHPGETDRGVKAREQTHWRTIAAQLAWALWQSSTIAPSRKQAEVQMDRALHRRGIGTHKWLANISGKAKVTSVDAYLSPSEKTHSQNILSWLKRLKQQQLGERITNSLVFEKGENLQNRATLTYFATLNAEHDVEERYRLAVAQIPKMLQYKFDDEKLVEYTKDEIKRRFHNTPGHPLYYNRTNKSGGIDLRTEAATKLIALAREKLATLKQTLTHAEDNDELRRVLESYRDELKASTASKIPHKDLNAEYAKTFEDKFGDFTFIHPITGADRKQLISMAKV
jgi:hypothetical protein